MKCRITEKLFRLLMKHFGRGDIKAASEKRDKINKFLRDHDVGYQLVTDAKLAKGTTIQMTVKDHVTESGHIDAKNSIRGDHVASLMKDINDLLDDLFPKGTREKIRARKESILTGNPPPPSNTRRRKPGYPLRWLG